MTSTKLRRAKSTSSVPRSSSFASLAVNASPLLRSDQVQSKLAVQAANVAFGLHSQLDSVNTTQQHRGSSGGGGMIALRRSKSQSNRNGGRIRDDVHAMTMGERAEKGLRRERSLKRTLRGVEPGIETSLGALKVNTDRSGNVVRKVRSMGYQQRGFVQQSPTLQHAVADKFGQCGYNQHDQYAIKIANPIGNVVGKENASPSTTSFMDKTSLPPYSSPGPSSVHPLMCNPSNFQNSVGPGRFRYSVSAIEPAREMSGPINQSRSNSPIIHVPTSTTSGSRTARLRHRASFILSPLQFRARKSSPTQVENAAQNFGHRKWSAGSGISALSNASRRSRAESLRDKLKRYFRKSSGGSNHWSESVENSRLPEQQVEAKRNYYTSSNLAASHSRLTTPVGPYEVPGSGNGTIKVKGPNSECETMQSKSRVTSWADSSIIDTVLGESRNVSRLSMIVEDNIKSSVPASTTEKRDSSIGGSFLKRLMRRSTATDNTFESDPASLGYEKRHASFVSLASWRNKSTVRSVTPDMGNIIPEDSGTGELLAGCKQPPNTPYSTILSNANDKILNCSPEQGNLYRPSEEQLASREQRAKDRWKAPMDEHRSLFFPRSPSSPSKSRLEGIIPEISPRSTPIRKVTTIVKLNPVVTNLEKSFNSLREPESPGSPDKFGAMSPSVYSRATDDEKPIFGATVANLLAGWESPEKEYSGPKKGSESGEWRNWISKEVQDFDTELDIEDLNASIDRNGDDTTIMQNEVMEGTLLDPPTPKMLKEDETHHRREFAEVDSENETDSHNTSAAEKVAMIKSKGKEPLRSSPLPSAARYRLKRHAENKPARPVRFELTTPAITSMNDRFPMLDTGLQRSHKGRGSPAKKITKGCTTQASSSPGIVEEGNSSILLDQTRPYSTTGARAVDVTLASPAMASTSRVSLIEVNSTRPSLGGQEVVDNNKWTYTFRENQQLRSTVTLGAQSVSTYYTAKGSPLASTPTHIDGISAFKESPSFVENINSSKKMNTKQNLSSAGLLLTPITTPLSTNTSSPSSSNTLRPVEWHSSRRFSERRSHLSPSLASLESDMQLLDVLRGQHRNAHGGVDMEYDKENASPHIRAILKREPASQKSVEDTKHGDSPGKKMAERWLNERRSETFLRPGESEAGRIRAESALA